MSAKSVKASRGTTSARGAKAASAAKSVGSAKPLPTRTRVRNVKPDAVDFRDLPFRPAIGVAPALSRFPDYPLPVKNQLDTSACTGFSLSLVVEYLSRRSAREPGLQASPFMLYWMARRYDEFPGAKDAGSSLRGALKGWHKHGACADALWQTGVDTMPPATPDPAQDWWLDAVRRPLGAYYRIDIKQIADIHAALNEVGIVYASVDTHKGWDAGVNGGRKEGAWKQRPKSFDQGLFAIPYKPGSAGGHAIALVGYNERGFLLQNSWDTDWGSYGYAILTYQDWVANAMDCWAVQLGVVTEERLDIARNVTLRTTGGNKVELSKIDSLRDREVSPFVVNMENNGKLSSSGLFRTTPGDLEALVSVHLAEARKRWRLGGKPIDICIYAHGGLVGEGDAAKNAAKWVPALYAAKVFPVYLMWETDFMSTVLNRISDSIRGVARAAGAGEGVLASMERMWNTRLERLLAPWGSQVWGEMKQNADAMSDPQHPESGVLQLWQQFCAVGSAAQPVRFHLVGHSAGSIVHCQIVERLATMGIRFETVSFLAPAVTVSLFDRTLRKRLDDGSVRRYQQFHLTAKAEEDDPTCGPYRRSLLHLVAESFEGGQRTPIQGMEVFNNPQRKPRNTTIHVAPGPTSQSTTHGGFDDDPATLATVLEFITRGR
jgi:hypothetical protein